MSAQDMRDMLGLTEDVARPPPQKKRKILEKRPGTFSMRFLGIPPLTDDSGEGNGARSLCADGRTRASGIHDPGAAKVQATTKADGQAITMVGHDEDAWIAQMLTF